MTIDSSCISVIVPAHVGGARAEACLIALAELDPPPKEILIVADGPAPGLRSAVDAQETDRMRFLSSETAYPRGPGHARNRGARRARGDVLFFVDADVVVPPDAVGRLSRILEREAVEAVIGSYDFDPADPAFLSQYRNLLHAYVHQTSRENAATFWGACGAVRRDAFLAVGGFDERYRRPSIEDVDLGVRLREAGYRIRLEKDLQVRHLKRWTVVGMLLTDIRDRALPWTELIHRDGLGRGMRDDLNLDHGSRWSGVITTLLVVLLFVSVRRPTRLVRSCIGLCVTGLLWLNRGFYGFLRRLRGTAFTLAAIPWHWLYFLYSSVAFGVGTGLRVLGLGGASRRNKAPKELRSSRRKISERPKRSRRRSRPRGPATSR